MDEHNGSEPPAPSAPLTWTPTPGVPVYGYTPATAPPDFERPWVPPASAQQQPPAYRPVDRVDVVDGVDRRGASEAQLQQQPVYAAIQVPPQPTVPLPSPLGPALTPEERAMQAGVPPAASSDNPQR